MLQQTTTSTAAPYFQRFIARWPTLEAFASARAEEVLGEWAGLGYYSRARNAIKCAGIVMTRFAGTLPKDYTALLALPGIGPYTAAAIMTIAHDMPAPIVDGNIARVVARLEAIDTPLPQATPQIRMAVMELMAAGDCGNLAQALMDLGARICTPRDPKCGQCVLRAECAARLHARQHVLPRKPAKAQKQQRAGHMYVIRRVDGAILLHRRPASGLLGGMAGPPATPFIAQPTTGRAETNQTGTGTATPRRQTDEISTDHAHPEFPADMPAAISCLRKWRRTGPPVRHVFTHFSLALTVWRADVDAQFAAPDGFWWSSGDALPREALPTLMKKALRQALAPGEAPPNQALQKIGAGSVAEA